MPLSPQEKDNLIRWDGFQKPFYEVYYFKWNDLSQGIAGWMRYTLLASIHRKPEASIWGIFFDARDPKNNIGIKQTFPLAETRIEKDIFYFSAGSSAIFDGGARGDICQDHNVMAWEIKLGEEALSLRHFPWPLYLGGFPKTKLLAPSLSTTISGEFIANNQKFTLSHVPAHQAHLWGAEQAASWVWGNCNTFKEDSNFCFEGLSARVTMAEKLSPPMTLLFFYWNQKMYAFNSPHQWLMNKSHHDLDRWHFEAATRELRFVGDVFCSPEEISGVRYDDPTGSERFCHNTKIADMKIQIFKKQTYGWDCVQTLTASKSAAFEVVQAALDPRVKLLIP